VILLPAAVRRVASIAVSGGPVSGGDILPAGADLGAVLDNLVEVAAWTSADGQLQEHASFLLRTVDGQWTSVEFADPAATGLVSHLNGLAGFDGRLLFELLGSRARRIVTLWRHPQLPERSRSALNSANPVEGLQQRPEPLGEVRLPD
jgi:hypothetical protein